jgi:ribosomal protein S18 acetylase RimI-like enzyme
MTSPLIRAATEDDIAAIKLIADGCKREVGFISRGMLRNAMGRGELLVAEINAEVAGFVDFHQRKDGQITIYGIVVGAEWRRQGIGRALTEALGAKQPLRIALKCPTDNAANTFYAAIGFQCVGVEAPTKRRPLNLWTRMMNDE